MLYDESDIDKPRKINLPLLKKDRNEHLTNIIENIVGKTTNEETKYYKKDIKIVTRKERKKKKQTNQPKFISHSYSNSKQVSCLYSIFSNIPSIGIRNQKSHQPT